MGELSTAGLAERISVQPALRLHDSEPSAAAVAYIALAMGGVLALVWVVGMTWIFGLVTG
ncbi:hypothetical protein SAMN05444161_7216 [Rhizobiales bacterium GAS191]|nr:hypothetical protein SAMN05519103_06565 [Rhizobiales bacterium GAS113]SED74039.1 hypothetical protein SAMN05519104_4234 [Rhizobiales bacterium GAS188]SEE80174.1 hypothetical protein SAMN05444161_7216 [Rhizobiales bacterium GAS191]